MSESRIIVALDTNDPQVARDLVGLLWSHVYAFKIGLELMMTMIRRTVAADLEDLEAATNLSVLRELFGFLKDKLFLDTKFHDIPNTVGGAAAVVSELGIAMFNVHASAGSKAIAAAAKNKGKAKLLAVTILTSLKEECEKIYGQPPDKMVPILARLAVEAGADGIISSAEEAPMLRRENFMQGKIIVTPGIRPAGAEAGDQKRITTPFQAIMNRADYLVVGRPITEAADPVAAAIAINEEVEKAWASRQ